MEVKGLIIKEPWLALISLNKKTIEIRTRRTNYRGPILLASSKENDENYAFIIRTYFNNDDSRISWPLGKAYVLANLVDCHPMQKTDQANAKCLYHTDLFAWVLEDIQIVRP